MTWPGLTPTAPAGADLADPQGADRLASAVADRDIGVLVNNAGFGYAGRLDKQDTERLRALVQVNCAAPLVLTSRLLPKMRERGRGAIIITGSIAGQQPMPRLGYHGIPRARTRHRPAPNAHGWRGPDCAWLR